jgi:hypothetical protein
MIALEVKVALGVDLVYGAAIAVVAEDVLEDLAGLIQGIHWLIHLCVFDGA